jgi:hypothetical protein
MLYMLNAHISLPIFGCRNTIFFSSVYVENICFDGFSLTESLEIERLMRHANVISHM